MTVTLRYFTEFGKLAVFQHLRAWSVAEFMHESIVFCSACHRKESSRSLSHLLMSFLILLQLCGRPYCRGPHNCNKTKIRQFCKSWRIVAAYLMLFDNYYSWAEFVAANDSVELTRGPRSRCNVINWLFTISRRGSSENLLGGGFQLLSLGRNPKGSLENLVSGVHL